MKKILLVMTTVVAGMTLQAKTCTWVGSSSGLWSEATNWSEGSLPASGDTVVFSSAVTLNDETVDAGADGFIIDNSAEVKSGIVFTGAGKIVKRGGGKFQITHPWKTTGGFRIENGVAYVDQFADGPEHNAPDPFGTGTIEIAGSGSLNTFSWYREWKVPLLFTDNVGGTTPLDIDAVDIFQNCLTANGDITIDNAWAATEAQKFNGGFYAPGHTVTLTGGDAAGCTIGKGFEASLVKSCGGKVLLNTTTTNRNVAIRVAKGELEMSATCTWAGSSVTVNNGGTLTLQAGGNFQKMPALTIDNGGKIAVKSGSVHVSALTVAGAAKAKGTYTAADLPDVLTAGEIVVADSVLLWVGGSTGSWSEASNWEPAQVPQGGDTVLFTKEVTLAEETVDVGTKGLTIVNDATVTGNIVFTGAGKIVKSGSGYYSNKKKWTTTGGLRLEGGTIHIGQEENNCADPFGTGSIEVTGAACFSNASWAREFKTPIVISAFKGADALYFAGGGPVHFSGLVSSDSDFGVTVGWTDTSHFGNARFTGGLSAPGKTVEVKGDGGLDMSGAVDVSIVKKNTSTLSFKGVMTNPENKITVTKGEFVISSAGTWKGTNIVVETAGKLTVNSALSPLTEVRVATGGKISVLCESIHVGSLIVAGEVQPNGTYTAANLPDLVTDGQVIVDDSVLIWVGGATGAWGEAANWSPAHVPQSGDAVLFTSAVTLSDETVDVGEAGLTIEAAAEVKSGIVFTGSGKIVKRGAGRYETTHPWKTTGGLRIEGGSMYVNQLSGSEHNSSDPFGTGTIEITDKGYFAHDSWARTFTTPFVIRSLTRANAFSFASSGPAIFSGLISSDSDFSIEAGWTSRSSGGPAKFSGGISAPGKTVEFKGGGSQVGGTVNVSIVQNNNAEVYFNGTQTNPENALTVRKGTFMFAPDAVWQGGAVSVASGCKLDIAKGVRVRATNFTVNGEAKPEGRYTAANLPDTITGGGVLRVGGPLGMLLIVR